MITRLYYTDIHAADKNAENIQIYVEFVNISVYAPWREYRARIFKIQSRECVSTAWKERAIQRKANSQTPAILNVAPRAQWRCSSLFKLFHFSSRPFCPSLSYSSTKYSPPPPLDMVQESFREISPSRLLQQRCTPNKHPRLTSPPRVYIPRIPRREESAVEEASVTSLPLTILVEINSLPPSFLSIGNFCPRLFFFNCNGRLVARLKILLANFATEIKIRVERKSKKIRLGSPTHCSMHTWFWIFTLVRNRYLRLCWRYEEFLFG